MANPLDCVELPESRSLLIAMHDGTLRTILRDDNEASPRLSTLEDPREANDSSLALCESLRTSFRIIEKTGNRSKNKASLPVTAAMLMSGFAQLDTMGTVFLAYEKHLLDRKLYVMPNTRYSHFALARIDNDGLEQKIMQATTKALKQDSSTGKPAR